MTIKKILFYSLIACILFAAQFLYSRGLATGKPPELAQTTIQGERVSDRIATGPGLIYFWAEWCRICAMMQAPVGAVLNDFPGVTVALRSGDADEVKDYLDKKALNWPAVIDKDGLIGDRFGIRGVPAVFILNPEGEIVFTSVGYSTEWGLRFRLWLAAWF